MRDRIIIAAAAILLGWPSRGVAADGGDRVLVELAISESLPADQASRLASLLESQLSTQGLSLRRERGPTELRPWLARGSDDALLRVALDASAAGGWRLLLVDATRGRAISRTLTRSVTRDRAAIEAVCDIVVSAAAALREGLEVASQTLDDALTDAPRADPAPATQRGGDSPAVARSAAAPTSSAALRLQAGAGPTMATLARAAPASWGAAAAIAVWRGAAGLELSAARYLGQTIAASEGSFEIERTQVGLSVAVETRPRQARLSADLGVALEILQRGAATPGAATVAGTAADSALRVGPQTAAAVSLSVARRVAVTWGLGLGYFPRQIKYLSATGSGAALAEPWPFVGTSTLRVDVSLP